MSFGFDNKFHGNNTPAKELHGSLKATPPAAVAPEYWEADYTAMSVVPSGATFSRPSAAGYVDASKAPASVSNDTPRFDHHPVTGAPRGYLVEGQRTNYLLNSFTPAGGGSVNPAPVSNSVYSASMLGSGSLFVGYSSSFGGGNVTATLGVPRTISIGTSGNFYTITPTNCTAYQLEVGGFATSIIPTAGVPVTRYGDTLTYPDAPATMGWNNTEYTVLMEYELPTAGTSIQNTRLLRLNNSAVGSNEYIYATFTSTGLRIRGNTQAGGPQFQLDSAGLGNSVGTHKVAFRVKTNDIAAYIDGSAAGTDTLAVVPTVKEVNVGHENGSAQLFGWVRKMRVYPRALTDAELQALTL